MKRDYRTKPRIGFLGTGWIGRHRLEAVRTSGVAEIVAIADICAEHAREAAAAIPGVQVCECLADLLRLDLDGVVIATPSAAHAEQALAALEQGVAVFCQKPLARTARETELIVAAARKANRLLGVDFSYRYTAGVQKIRDLIKEGELGRIYAADLVFHNAYGPDKPWFYDARLSGGGCLMDLGSHLVDLALWLFDFPRVRTVTSSIFAHGERLDGTSDGVEDFATVALLLEDGGIIRLACSWNISAGRDAVIETTLFGTKGGACFRNVNGSFYDFTAEHFRGTALQVLASPPDDWGGRAVVAWVKELQLGGVFNPEAEKLIPVAVTLDAAYGR